MEANREANTTRTVILEAADRRFRQYGYNKTTMAEIASDCGMSASNLYRFFENKLDIGVGLAHRCFEQKESLLQAVVSNPGISASARLREFILTLLRYTHDQCNDQPRLNEMVQAVIQERQDVVDRKIRGERVLLAAILEQGKAEGEFELDDPLLSADTILTSVIMFSTPFLINLYPLEMLENMAVNISDLLLRGLLSR